MLKNKIVFAVSFLIFAVSFTASAQYETRPVNTCTLNGNNYSAYQTCINDYNTRLRDYNSFHSTTTSTRAPSPPNYGTCDRTAPDGTVTRDQTCLQNLERSYQTDLQNYNTIKQQEEIARQQTALQTAQYQASREAAKAAEEANKKAQERYQRSQFLSTAASLAFMTICPAIGGQWACPVGAFFAMMAGKAGTQAGSHNASAWQACNVGNSLGTSQTNCGPPPATFNPSTFPNNTEPSIASVIDQNGNCTASPEVCSDLQNGLPSGVSLQDVARGLSSFAGGKTPPLKLDANGNAIGKDGKKYSASAINSVEGLKAMGFSEADAKKLLANMAKYNEDGSGLAGDGKGGGSGSGGDGSAFGDGSGLAGAGGSGGAGNGDADGSSADIGGGKRKMASAEGLARDFNGELIGVAGDDIFKMMNRRYQLKTKQDTFINNK